MDFDSHFTDKDLQEIKEVIKFNDDRTRAYSKLIPNNFLFACAPFYEYRFIVNALPVSKAMSVFGKPPMKIKELKYKQGYYYPLFNSFEDAVQFISSNLFGETYKKYINMADIKFET